jgi:ubiquinone/menaquinone biosynthesis C-methylase UbiE
MKEGFKPLPNFPSNGVFPTIINTIRMVFDLQLLTIVKDVKREFPKFHGDILDIGCGDSPYRVFLKLDQVKYFGIDIVDQDKFDYHNERIVPFDGKKIPFDDKYFDVIICTEVLEHVENFHELIGEMHRVMKIGANGFITVPWSARFHYIPYDYFRYTPSSLKLMFKEFEYVIIENRGTDLAVIANKLVILWLRNLMPKNWKALFIPLWIAFSPVLLVFVALAHFSIWFNWGSKDDPLGYTIQVKK